MICLSCLRSSISDFQSVWARLNVEVLAGCGSAKARLQQLSLISDSGMHNAEADASD